LTGINAEKFKVGDPISPKVSARMMDLFDQIEVLVKDWEVAKQFP
jgi:hypothetical protein